MQKKLSFLSATLWILSSILVICGPTYFGIHLYQKWQRNRLSNPQYFIQSIIQTGIEKEALPTQYLAELLDLSYDQPQNLFRFDESKAEKQLIQSPWIKSATIQKIPPSSLYIDYEIRKPVATLADFENLAIDKEGYFIPSTQMDLPAFYLGLNSFSEEKLDWNHPLKDERLDVAFKLLQAFSKEKMQVLWIDVSQIHAKSFGKREIVVRFIDFEHIQWNKEQISCFFPRIIRLNTRDLAKQMGNYLVLKKRLWKDYEKQILQAAHKQKEWKFEERVFDFRIPELGFIQE